MNIATILPNKYLHLEDDNDYHLCLAHLLHDRTYREWFREKATRGDMVIMDNGVVETGKAMEMSRLMDLGASVGVSEIILPDEIYNRDETLFMGMDAMSEFVTAMGTDYEKESLPLMAVPQGATAMEWVDCVKRMIEWPVRTIGISRFTNKYFTSRLRALECVPELINSDKQIHLLGCPGDPIEFSEVETSFPGRIRGIDSGVAVIYATAGILMGDDPANKPNVEIDFFGEGLNDWVVRENVEYWRKRSRGNF